MKTVKLEGVATITSKGFSFDSGLPSAEVVVEKQFHMRGKMRVHENGCVDFVRSTEISLPPQIDNVAHTDEYIVKRSTRHYIIQVKVPVIESRQESEDKLHEMVTKAMGEITLDRQELLGGALS